MGELLDAVASWPSLLLALFVFGFAPGAALRLIVLAYHPDDERRDELRAELHAVPRWERPVWVAEQLETAIFLKREHVVDIWWSDVEYDPTVEYPHLANQLESWPPDFSRLRDI